MKRLALILAVAATSPLTAQVVPTQDKRVNRSLPDDPVLGRDTEFQKKYREAVRSENAGRDALRGMVGADAAPPPPAAGDEAAVGTPPGGSTPVESSMWPGSTLPGPSEPPRTLPKRTKTRNSDRFVPPPSVPYAAPYGVSAATPTLTFAVSREAAVDENTTVLPVGSFVKARVVSGVEANTLEPYPVLLQLEYAFTGPNRSKIDLSNCFMIAKARANLSTERVIMETDTLSCVREDGEHFKSSARGYTAGADSTFGSTGTFISKQGQVLLAAVLASIAKNAGEAVAAAQQSTTIAAGLNGAQTATNVTGDQAKYIAGRSVVDGAAMIAQWYLDYAKQLVPSIGIGSGEDVHVIMLETIRVPTLTD